MSDKEKDIIKRISENVRELPNEKKEYLLGVSEGMALMKSMEQQEPKKAAG